MEWIGSPLKVRNLPSRAFARDLASLMAGCGMRLDGVHSRIPCHNASSHSGGTWLSALIVQTWHKAHVISSEGKDHIPFPPRGRGQFSPYEGSSPKLWLILRKEFERFWTSKFGSIDFFFFFVERGGVAYELLNNYPIILFLFLLTFGLGNTYFLSFF